MEHLVYIAVILNGVTLVSPDPVPSDKCEQLRKYNTALVWMCIDKEPDCGKASGNPECKGPIYDVPTKRYARKR